MDQYNPQQKLFSLVRSAEVSSVTLRNLTARTVRDDTAPFYCEVADLLGIKVEETHDWLKISVPAILPKRNQRDNQAFLTRPLRYAIMDYLKENPIERFGSCAICIVHNYDAALGKRRIRDYDNIETKRYLDVIESMLLTNDSGLLVLSCFGVREPMDTGVQTLFATYISKCSPLPEWMKVFAFMI